VICGEYEIAAFPAAPGQWRIRIRRRDGRPLRLVVNGALFKRESFDPGRDYRSAAEATEQAQRFIRGDACFGARLAPIGSWSIPAVTAVLRRAMQRTASLFALPAAARRALWPIISIIIIASLTLLHVGNKPFKKRLWRRADVIQVHLIQVHLAAASEAGHGASPSSATFAFPPLRAKRIA
jgi:hypothetical protein